MSNYNNLYHYVMIYGISGRAQSGKTTLANHIKAQAAIDYPDYDCHIIHFADALKEIVVQLFDVDPYKLYDDNGKKDYTNLRWENMPGVITSENTDDLYGLKDYGIVYHKPGLMTGREVLEYFGTGICRKIKETCWINATFHKIIKRHKQKSIFIIPDVRSPNEVAEIQAEQGFVDRLTRDPEQRQSEIECYLDKENYNWNKFNNVIDNKNLTIKEKNAKGYESFKKHITTYIKTI